MGRRLPPVPAPSLNFLKTQSAERSATFDDLQLALMAPPPRSTQFAQMTITMRAAYFRALHTELQYLALHRYQFVELLFLIEVGDGPANLSEFRRVMAPASARGGAPKRRRPTVRLGSGQRRMDRLWWWQGTPGCGPMQPTTSQEPFAAAVRPELDLRDRETPVGRQHVEPLAAGRDDAVGDAEVLDQEVVQARDWTPETQTCGDIPLNVSVEKEYSLAAEREAMGQVHRGRCLRSAALEVLYRDSSHSRPPRGSIGRCQCLVGAGEHRIRFLVDRAADNALFT